MAFDNLPKYTDIELENVAASFLGAHYGAAVRIPVDVDWLLAKLGVGLDDFPALRDNYFVEGCVVRNTQTGKLTVYIDEKVMGNESAQGIARYRTTVAEELAHILIHRELIEQVDSADKFRQLHNQLQDAKVERNAKRLAAALLMPRESVWEAAGREYVYWVQRQGTDEREALKLMMCGSLFHTFRVSHAAMNMRLKELKVYDAIEDAAYKGRPRLL